MEKESWLGKMTAAPADLARESKAEFMKTLKNVAISSDAFFPFRDSIDVASAHGVEFVSQLTVIRWSASGHSVAIRLAGPQEFRSD